MRLRSILRPTAHNRAASVNAYRSYELRDNPGPVKAIEKGYYVRVWKRRANGKWGVTLDVTGPLPPEQK